MIRTPPKFVPTWVIIIIIKKKGLKYGLYSSAGTGTCQGEKIIIIAIPKNKLKNRLLVIFFFVFHFNNKKKLWKKKKGRPGGLGFEQIDAQTYAEWEVGKNEKKKKQKDQGIIRLLFFFLAKKHINLHVFLLFCVCVCVQIT